MCVTQGDRQCIGGIGLRFCIQSQQGLDHVLDLILAGGPGAYNGLLDFTRRIFGNLDTPRGNRTYCCAARLSQFQGRIGVPMHEYFFNCHLPGFVLLDNLVNTVKYDSEFVSELIGFDADTSAIEVAAAPAIGFDNTKTCDA